MTHRKSNFFFFKSKKNGIKNERSTDSTVDTSLILSLLSDSNQRPRDYKSRALAN